MDLIPSEDRPVSLIKRPPSLTSISVRLGWDTRSTVGADFDLDVSALLLNTTGKVLSNSYFVFFNNPSSPDGSVQHLGDNSTGKSPDHDDEALEINLAAVPLEASRVVFSCSIYDGLPRAQNFGQVRNAYIRIVNNVGGAEIARLDLSEDAPMQTAIIFGELYRDGAEWKFQGYGDGFSDGLAGIARAFGVTIE